MRIPMAEDVLQRNRQIKEHSQQYQYFDLTEEFCNNSGCRQATDAGFLIVYDVVHLTPEGATFVGAGLTQRAWFKAILESSNLP